MAKAQADNAIAEADLAKAQREATKSQTPSRDPRLEFNKLINFLGTKPPRVYWLRNCAVGGLESKHIQNSGNYHWRKPSKNGVSYQSINMKVTNHNFDSVQNIGTIVWTEESDLHNFDQAKWDFAVELNKKSISVGLKGDLDPRKQATLQITDTDNYKATIYFSNGWSVQKIESSSDSSNYQVSTDKKVRAFFETAVQTALK